MRRALMLVAAAALLLGGSYFYSTQFTTAHVRDAICRDCNIILITLTNLRYDHLSGNGYPRPTSPHLDALASESLVFDNAFAHSSWTLPEGISMYTSQYPYTHGVMNRYDGSSLNPKTPSILDILNKNGYETAAFTGMFDYDQKFGLMNRVGTYRGCTKGEGRYSVLAYGNLDCTAPKALSWIKENADKKFFVHLQGFDAHCPFSQSGGVMYDSNYAGTVDFSQCLWTFQKTEPHAIHGKEYYLVYSPDDTGRRRTEVLLDEDDVRHLIALYDESVTNSDALIGSFLEEIRGLGLERNTIIVFTSEHGDMFGKYGRFMRGGPVSGTFYDDVLHVPLFMKIPGLGQARIRELVQHIDLAPTLLDLVGVPKRSTFEGRSLVPLIVDGEKINDHIFAGAEFYPDKNNLYITKHSRTESVRTLEWKLIKEQGPTDSSQAPTYELFNVSRDPEERLNLVESEAEVFNDLSSKLSRWSERARSR